MYKYNVIRGNCFRQIYKKKQFNFSHVLQIYTTNKMIIAHKNVEIKSKSCVLQEGTKQSSRLQP